VSGWSAERKELWRRERLAARVLIDGRLVAPLPPNHHGKHATYANHGCRCEPCGEANRNYCRQWKARYVEEWGHPYRARKKAS
jgi:hypothetical protein